MVSHISRKAYMLVDPVPYLVHFVFRDFLITASGFLREQFVHYAAFHIGEAKVAAGVAERQLLVIQPE